MSSVQDDNSQEVLNQTYSSKDFAKDAIKLQEASVDEIVEYASKNFDLDTNQIESFRSTIGEIKTNVVTGVLAWDTSKSTGENIAYVTGTLVQDYGEGLLVGVVATAGFPEFVLGLSVSYVANEMGIDLGQEFEKLYNYAQDFQSTNAIETQRFEALQTTNPEAYQNMVQSGVFPQNTTQWNTHVNELTKDLYNRKAENLKSTINYENSAEINENTTLSDIAQANGLTEKQILDYNNLNIKPDDYGNIQTGTKIAIPNKPDVSDGVTIYTDNEGNQKIISVDTITGKETVFYYNAKDYSLLEINGNTQTYNKVNADGSVSTQKLGLGSIEVINSNNSANNITVKNISEINHDLIYDSTSSIHSNTQLEVLLRQNTNNNLSLKDLAHANGYSSEAELREAFKNGEVITTPTKQLISTDEYGNKVSEYNMGNNIIVKSTTHTNGEVVNENHTSNTIETPTFNINQPIIDNNNYTINNRIIPIQPNQTISHIAQKTDFNSIDLLEYNNITLEEAKSLPVGYKVLVPKEKPINIEGEYGTIKLFGNHDDTFTARFPDEQNNKTNITFSEDSDLLIYGDRTNPNKITFTDKETFQSWEKDDNGIMYLKELSSDDFDISFKIENGKKVLDSIEIKADNVSLEKLAKYTDYTKEELKEFNHLESDTLNKDSNLQIPVSKKEIEGGHGKINQYTTQDGEYVFIVPNGDSSTSTYATFTDGFNQKGAYEINPNGSININFDDRVIIANEDGYYFDSYGLEDKVDIEYERLDNGDLIVQSFKAKQDLDLETFSSKTNFDKDQIIFLNSINNKDGSVLEGQSIILPKGKMQFIDSAYGKVKVQQTADGNYVIEAPNEDKSISKYYTTKNAVVEIDKETGEANITLNDGSTERVIQKDAEGKTIDSANLDWSGTGKVVINQIGSLIIANNDDFSNIEKITVSTVIGTVSDISTNSSATIENSFIENLKGTALSFAISSYFAKNDNISDWIGADGTFGGEMLDFTAQYIAVDQISHYLFSTDSTTIVYGADGINLNWTSLGSVVGGFIGSAAANAIMDWDTKEESIGSSIGSAIGTAIGVAAAGTNGVIMGMKLGSFAGPIGALIGAFIGAIVGGLLGGLFGGTPPPPEAEALFEFDEETGTYKLLSSDSDNGGNEEAMINMGNAFAKHLTNVFKIPGGQLVDASLMPDINISQFKENVSINGYTGKFATSKEAMAHALSVEIPFINVENGNPYILRAIHRTNDKFLEGNPDAETGRADIDELYENIKIAQEYSNYMNETMLILDSDGKPITDNDRLLQINQEYLAIQTIENEDEKTSAMEAFAQKYHFTTYKEYVDSLQSDISQEDIDSYLNERNILITQFDEQISEADNKLSSINSELNSLESQLSSAEKMLENSNNSKHKNEIQSHIQNLNIQIELLSEDKQDIKEKISSLENQKEQALIEFDNEHFKEIDAIHWQEVFAKAEELQLDEHHYSEDFNKLNSEIAKYNYEIHEENEELLEVDINDYLEQIAHKMIEVIKRDDSSITEDEQLISKEEATSVLKELGYDLSLGYERYNLSLNSSGKTIKTTFDGFLNDLDVLKHSNLEKMEISAQRFEELLELADIPNPYENFEISDDAFSFAGKTLNDLQFELKDGKLIITTFDKDLEASIAEENSQEFVISNWEKWDKTNTHIDLPNGTRVNLEAFLDLIGVEENGGKVDVKEAFERLLEEDESLAKYVNEFDDVYFDTSLDDKITAYYGDNLIVLGKGKNSVITGAGDDLIVSKEGIDTIDGGLGNDTVTYEHSEGSVHASLEKGGLSGDAKGDTYKNVENLFGSNHDDYLEGDENSNILLGNKGNDVLSGGEGSDTLDGGDGIDLADYSNHENSIVVNLETNYSSDNDTFKNIEGVKGTLNDDVIVTGSEDNIVFGNDGNDNISLGDGENIVYTGSGNNYVKGGNHKDNVYAQDGDDIIITQDGDDYISAGEGKNVIYAGEGKDLVEYKDESTQYTIMFLNDNTILVKSNDKKTLDTLIDVEQLAFKDALFEVDYLNKQLIKKVEVEVVEEEQNEETSASSETNPNNSTATALATAAMIGTVAAAQTVESSDDTLIDYFTNKTENIDEETQENSNLVVEKNNQINYVNEDSVLLDSIRIIEEYKQNILENSEILDEKDQNSQIVLESENDSNNQNNLTQADDYTVFDSNIDKDNNDSALLDSNKISETNKQNIEEVEEDKELDPLLVPIVELTSTIFNEDEKFFDFNISNPNIDSSLQVVFSGIPENFSLSAGLKQPNGDWILTQNDLVNLALIPEENNSNDFDITIRAIVTDIHGRIIDNQLTQTLTIVAVADTPDLIIEEKNETLDEDTFVNIDIKSSLNDVLGGFDGEESLIISLENIPDDAYLNKGKKNSDGVWYLEQSDLDNLTIFTGLHNSNDFIVNVTAYAIESENNSIASISDTINITVNAVADIANLDVKDSLGDEDTAIILDISSSLVDMDGSEVLSLQIKDIPEGAILNKGTKDEFGIWHLTSEDLSFLTITPTEHDSDDFTVTVTATTKENENGNIAQISKTIDVSVNAVADKVELDLFQATTSGMDSIMIVAEDPGFAYIDIASEFIDKDGSESLHYLIEGLPEGTSLTSGERLESGVWKVLPTQLEELSINMIEHSDENFTLKVTAVTTELENGHQEFTSKDLEVRIESEADFATLNVDDSKGYINSFINLNIQSSLVDKDGSETLDIILEQVPSGAVLNKGVKDENGFWHLKQEDLVDLKVRPEFDTLDDFELKVRAVSTEKKNGHSVENIAYVKVDVEPIPATAKVTVTPVNILEDEVCNLDINVDISELHERQTLHLELTVPENTSLNKGEQLSDSLWKLTLDELEQLELSLPEHYAGSFNVEINTIIKEPNGDITRSDVAFNLPVDITAVADEPILILENQIDVNEDELVYLNLKSKLVDIDGSEKLHLEILGLPQDIKLNTGKKIGDIWTIDSKDINKVAFIPPENFAGEIDFQVKSISTDSNGDEAQKVENVKVVISEVVDKPILNAVDSSTSGSQADLFIDSKLIDKDGSEKLKIIISDIPEGVSLNNGQLNEDGTYTLNKSDLKELKVIGVSEDITLKIKAISEAGVLSDFVETTLKVSKLEDTKPIINLKNLESNADTINSDILSYTDASDDINSGGGNDTILSKGGNDKIFSDEKGGTTKTTLELDIKLPVGSSKEYILKVDNLPNNVISSVGLIKDNSLYIDLATFDGKITLDYPSFGNDNFNLSFNIETVESGNSIETFSFEENFLSPLHIEVLSNEIDGNDNISSSSGDDTIYAEDGNDIILAGSGNDTILAGNGNDYIEGGTGSDKVDAGAGDDIIVIDSSDLETSDLLVEVLDSGEGYDTVIVDDTQGINFDMGLTNTEKFVGSTGDDNIIGSDNDDLIIGSQGVDTYFAKGGNDTVYIDEDDIKSQSGDFIDMGSGYDKIYIDSSEDVVFDVSNSNAEEIYSGSGNDILKNDSKSTVSIFGMDGDDTIFASSSKDILNGGNGIDTINYSNSTQGINLNLDTGEVSRGFAQNDEISNFENIIATKYDDNIIGDNNNNIIYATSGNDVINGLGGEDTVVYNGRLIDYYNGKDIKNIVTSFDSKATIFTTTGINELENISSLKFDDYTVYLDGRINSPFVYNDEVTTKEDTTVTINTSALLENDFSINTNDELKIIGLKNSQNGNAILNSDGTISFIPHDNYNSSTNNTFDRNSALYKGNAGFEYIVEDKDGNQSTAFVNVNVSAVNDAPVLTSHYFYRNSLLTGRGRFIIDDVDSNLDALNVSVVSSLSYVTSFYRGHKLYARGVSGSTNINGRTVEEDGEFHFAYRGSYWKKKGDKVFEMKSFVVKIADEGDFLTGENTKSIVVHTGTNYKYIKRDPIVLDLDGDGIEFTNKHYEEHEQFLDGVGKDDAVLFWDLNQDGNISSMLETNWVSLSENAENDLDVLREVFDSNNDGFFDSNDAQWKEFALWQDKNEDGLTSNDEIISISDSNIQRINLSSSTKTEAEGLVDEYSSYVTKDGVEKDLAASYIDTTITEDKLSEEDILVLQEATKLNEQLATVSEFDEIGIEIDVFSDLTIDEENNEENIA